MPHDKSSRSPQRHERDARDSARPHGGRRVHVQRRHAQMERESLRQLRELGLQSFR